MNQALEGLKVIDLSRVLAGPYCTMVLGDMGANVIKIERYPFGDDSRSMGPFQGEESYSFAMANRNKRSICLNIKKRDGLDILLKLVEDADVFIENFRPGVASKLGIDFDTLKAINPGLIYCSISGYGQTGPYKDKGGYDIMAQGLSGIMSMTGEIGGAPVKSGFAVNDIAAGVTAIYSILAAYIYKLRTQKGQYIDLALVDAGLAWTVWESAAYFGAGEVSVPNGSAHRVSAPYQGFQTKDGHILIGAANEKLWKLFCEKVVERPDWLEDPRFLTNRDRISHREELEQVIQEVIGLKESSYWLPRLELAGVPAGPISRYNETLENEHVLSREMVINYDHPVFGPLKSLGFPTKFSETPERLNRPAPTLGQHSSEILLEHGWNEREINSLRDQKII
ncbi:CaiB/BaiF CoA transferase family protein [Alkalicoccobacillus porphyridii]|uniref:CoA transferase n=1 Tax=Alkalicoccobacillus porphyridii TaxID=2597270 RepID=A0A554A1M5_9BACI|nr:CoA transferase [Alkalicoccobacillus porphyridii]TSB47600.1 CoA transferase [Alkalicoccobacillus porphyridii]